MRKQGPAGEPFLSSNKATHTENAEACNAHPFSHAPGRRSWSVFSGRWCAGLNRVSLGALITE